MFAISNLSKTARAALAAVVLGSAAISAAPAQAAGPGIGFWFGNGGSSVYFYGGSGGGRDWGFRRHRHDYCRRISTISARATLRRYGYHSIRLMRETPREIRFSAVYRHWQYIVTVDRCSGQVQSVRRSRHHGW
jgi:hypothetical protein